MSARTETIDAPTAGAHVVPPPKVEIEGVGKHFATPAGEIVALADVDLEIRDGEFMCLVGPSGCGKSTLLRILAGLERHSTGEVAVTREREDRPLSSMVFQDQSAFPWMNVADNVAYGLRARGTPRAQRQERAQRFIDLVGLRGYERLHPHQLSGGMRQRVSVARAFANDPELLLMDEPFGALDEQLKLVLQQELLRIWEQTRTTVVFVTHSLEEALALGDRVAVFGTRPGCIKTILDVPLARPRDVMELRSTPAFGELVERLWDLLREEVTKAYE